MAVNSAAKERHSTGGHGHRAPTGGDGERLCSCTEGLARASCAHCFLYLTPFIPHSSGLGINTEVTPESEKGRWRPRAGGGVGKWERQSRGRSPGSVAVKSVSLPPTRLYKLTRDLAGQQLWLLHHLDPDCSTQQVLRTFVLNFD